MQREKLTRTFTSQFLVSPSLSALYCKLSVRNKTSNVRGKMLPYFFGLSVPPSIRDKNGDSPVVVNVLAGKSVTLECESEAVPPPTITWYKNGRMVTESVNLRILAGGQTLQIRVSEVKLILVDL